MSIKVDLLQLTSRLAELTQRDEGLEFFLTLDNTYILDFKDKKLFLENSAEESSIAIRYLNRKGRSGIFSLTSPDLEEVLRAVEHTKLLSEFGHDGIYPELSTEYSKLRKVEKDRPTKDLFINLLEEARSVLTAYKKISRVERETLSWSKTQIFLIRAGKILSDELTTYGYSLSCVADGSQREASAFISVEATSPDKLNVKSVASWCAFKAEALSETRKRGSLKCSVLFPPEHAVELLGLLSFSLNGEEVLKKRSKLADFLGRKVFSEKLTVIDDGIDPELVESRAFDDEGVPQQRTVLVENGLIKSFIWNSLTALKSGFSSTGNARRPDLAGPPRVDFTNLYVAPGPVKRESLLRGRSQVFMVLELLGVHTADPISGDFSFGASGILYRDGEPVDYLAEMALSGNIFDLFKEVETGEDLTFFGAIGAPSLLFPEMSIG